MEENRGCQDLQISAFLELDCPGVSPYPDEMSCVVRAIGLGQRRRKRRREFSERCKEAGVDHRFLWRSGYSGIDIGVLVVRGFVFGLDDDFVGVGVFGVEDFFGEAD